MTAPHQDPANVKAALAAAEADLYQVLLKEYGLDCTDHAAIKAAAKAAAAALLAGYPANHSVWTGQEAGQGGRA